MSQIEGIAPFLAQSTQFSPYTYIIFSEGGFLECRNRLRYARLSRQSHSLFQSSLRYFGMIGYFADLRLLRDAFPLESSA